MSDTTTTPLAAQGQGPLGPLRSLLARYGIFLLLPALLLLGGVISPSFLSTNNISNLLLQIAPLGIVAIGQSFVMIVRGLDLSVASTMATAAVIATGFSGANGDVLAIVAVVSAIGIAVGLINGYLIAKRHVSPFLATLATMILLQGFRFAYTQGAPSGNVPPIFRTLGSGKFDGIPYNFAIFWSSRRCSGSCCIVRPSAAASSSSAAIQSRRGCWESAPIWSRSPVI